MKQRLEIKGNKAYFSKQAAKYRRIVEDEIAATTQDIADTARRNAPSDQGILRNSITAESVELQGLVQVRAEYAAYLEFGTGTRVEIPSNLKAYAATFKGNTTGTWEEFKLSLLAWMKRKGIEEKALFPIMMHIYRVGIRPQPFLFPAFQIESAKMMQRLSKKIRSSSK